MIGRFVALLLPLWAILFSLVCIQLPEYFSGFEFTIQPSLMLIMFLMGLTLKPKEFLNVIQLKKVIAITTVLQYLVMPLVAYILAVIFKLPAHLLIGMVLVGSVPGGTASNVIVFLSEGNVALSIVLTFVSTLLSIFMTPLLTWIYVGKTVDVPAWSMFLGILKIVFVPIFFGMLINYKMKNSLEGRTDYFAVLSVLCIVWIIGVVVSLNANQLIQVGWLLTVVVMIHNVIGLIFGYSVARLLPCDDAITKTITVEVGMQNSGLAVVLAIKYFGAYSALPAVIFSIWHNISGGILAGFWQNKVEKGP